MRSETTDNRLVNYVSCHSCTEQLHRQRKPIKKDHLALRLTESSLHQKRQNCIGCMMSDHIVLQMIATKTYYFLFKLKSVSL